MYEKGRNHPQAYLQHNDYNMLFTEQIFKLLAPHQCLACGREGPMLCAWCKPEAFAPLPERCYRCHKLSADSKVCESCRKFSRLAHVWVAAEYEGWAKQLLRAYKFERAKDVAELLAEKMDITFPYLRPDTIVTHVPTATSRVRERGYDHAAELAKAFASRRDFKFRPLLRRIGQSRQVGAKRQQRLSQLETAFRLRNGETVNGESILLIDDIVTTGASVSACAKILKAAGAKQINGGVFAQKQ